MNLFLAQSLDAGTVENLIKWMGLPGAILFIVIYAMCKKWIVPGWTYIELCTQRDALQAKCDRQEAQTIIERQKYLDVITRQQPLLERAVVSAEAASAQKGA